MRIMNLRCVSSIIKDLMISKNPTEQKLTNKTRSKDASGSYPDKPAEMFFFFFSTYFLFSFFPLHYEVLIFCTAVKKRSLMQMDPCLIPSHEAQNNSFSNTFPWHPYHRLMRKANEDERTRNKIRHCVLSIIEDAVTFN